MMAENIADIVRNLFGNEDSSEDEAAIDLPYIGLQIMRELDEGALSAANRMAANTILVDFSVGRAAITDSGQKKGLKNGIRTVLSAYLPGLKNKYSDELEDGSFVELLQGDEGVLVSLRGYAQGLVTCNIEYFKRDGDKPVLTYEQIRCVESELRTRLCSSRSKMFPPLKRGASLDVYLTTSDERILEYDIDKVVFEEKSPFQKVLIVHSRSLGNMLVLDDLQNISESDLVYTEMLMQRGKECYEGKEVVILGGGDGALLWELLKEKPKFVTMLEIDEVVIRACRKHLRSCCGTCLDTYKGDNYEIIIGDCVEVLKKFIAEGRKFDYVFGDLTDIPISTSPQGELWDFIRLILNSSVAVLKPNGKYMTHGNGASCPESLRMYEDQLTKLDTKVEFSRSRAFVPSFMEEWVFYQVWKKEN